MAPDTTRDKLADDLSGTLPPSCKHMEREEYRDCVLQMLEDLEQLGRRDGCIAAAWALDALPSLQRELAEARREITRLRLGMSGAADSMVSLGRSDYAEMIRDWIRSTPPGPSDAKGEHIGEVNKLVPLTAESVRGVLVDDGPVRNVFDYGECYLDLKDGSINTCWENARDPWSHNMQPVKLRPASEFGVPAEPAQKLVKLPEDVEVWSWIVRKPLKGERYRMPQHGPEEYVANDDFDNNEWPTWTKLDHALYGVDVERARLGLRIQALEASRDHALHAIAEAMAWPEAKNRSIENAVSNLLQWFDLCKAAHNAALKDVGERVMELEVEVERLRKAIWQHELEVPMGEGKLWDQKLWKTIHLSPSLAPAAESEGNAQHHSEGAKIPRVSSGSVTAASEGGDSQER